MRDVKVFLTERSASSKLSIELEKALSNYNIPVYHENRDCDTAIALKGDFINPLAFNGKRVLAFYLITDDLATIWDIIFGPLYKPILHHYYDELIDIGGYDTIDKMADRIAKEVKRLENETD